MNVSLLDLFDDSYTVISELLQWWMDKEVVAHIHSETLLSHEEGTHWLSFNEVDEPRTDYTEWSKAERER